MERTLGHGMQLRMQIWGKASHPWIVRRVEGEPSRVLGSVTALEASCLGKGAAARGGEGGRAGGKTS